MMKTPRTSKPAFPSRKQSLLKVVKYTSVAIGAVVVLCALIFILFPDPFINAFVKPRIAKAFAEAYPAHSLKLGDMHYSVWKNRLGCDSITLKTGDGTVTCSVASLSVSGIGWIKLLLHGEATLQTLESSAIDAHNVVLHFRPSQNELHCGMLHLSVPDSEMVIESVKYHSLIDDEQLFAKSQFRQTRFGFNVPRMKIVGLDCLPLLERKMYHARSITIHDVFADILVNMDKPYDKTSANPQMPNELFSSMKESVAVKSVTVTNGRLKYSERFALNAKPGEITFNKVSVSMSGIANHAVHPDTAVIRGEGVFMNSATMKLFMAIPLTSRDFSMRYSGSLGKMDVSELNAFIEAGEHRRMKSGVLESAAFDVNVASGDASGTLRAAYRDLSIVVLNTETGSEKGLLDRISSLFGKIFVVRRSNMPNEEGLLKIGEIKYTRDPEDYFLQYAWFALRNGIADVVGFPKKTLPVKPGVKTAAVH